MASLQELPAFVEVPHESDGELRMRGLLLPGLSLFARSKDEEVARMENRKKGPCPHCRRRDGHKQTCTYLMYLEKLLYEVNRFCWTSNQDMEKKQEAYTRLREVWTVAENVAPDAGSWRTGGVLKTKRTS